MFSPNGKIDPKSMSELRRYIEGLGGDAELLVGWEVYIVERPTDNRKKHADRYYYSPSKKKYRSKVEIARHFGLVKESAPRLSKNPRPTSPPRTTPRLSSPTPTSQTLPTLLSAAFAQSPNLLFPSDFQPYPVEASADLMTLEEADEPYPTSSTPSTISIIECSRCSKLHSLPSSIQSESLRSSSWTCNDNHWKPADSFCSQHSNDFEESSSVKSSCLESGEEEDTTTTTTTDVTPFTIPFEISYKTPIIIYVLLPPSNGSFKSPTPNISSFLKTLPFPQILVLGPVTLLHNKDRKEFSNKPIVKTGEGVELLLIRSAMTAMSNVCETFPYSRVYFASAGFGSRVAVCAASNLYENPNKNGFRSVQKPPPHPPNFKGCILSSFPTHSKSQNWYTLLNRIPASLDLFLIVSDGDKTCDLRKIEEVDCECTLLTSVLEGWGVDNPFKAASEDCLKKLRRAINSFTGFEQESISPVEGTRIEL